MGPCIRASVGLAAVLGALLLWSPRTQENKTVFTHIEPAPYTPPPRDTDAAFSPSPLELPPQAIAAPGLQKVDSDLCVVVISYNKNHRILMNAKQTWLSTTKHFFFSDKPAPQLPTTVIPNHPGQVRKDWSGNNPGDFRWLSAVLHANQSCRPYKWMLLADDDTYFVLPPLKAFVSKLDSSLPYYLGMAHPPMSHNHAVCYGPKKRRFQKSATCCLTTDSVCWTLPGQPALKPDFCPVAPCSKWPESYCKIMQPPVQPFARNETETRQLAPFWHYGGAGAIVSVAALDLIPEHRWRECAQKLVCGGGDRRFATCMLLLGNLTVTDGTAYGMSAKIPQSITKSLRGGSISFHHVSGRLAERVWRTETKLGMLP
eukprot:TRINITY_DN80981_c0_g1_i1.p1 TRINITY_DN80981_c0_g1~~TRINITY_DN80981_c0_g1_i1.p1  ORF type:complete len:372 (+),score=35.84 TRINITY_DN80981_c0_g1_i1:42-1157(+)